MDIFKAACSVDEFVIRCRRHIHKNPERSDQEEQPVAFISEEPTKLGIDHIDGGTSSNIIPDKLTFNATFHYTEAVQLDAFRADLERVCETFCDLYQCKAI